MQPAVIASIGIMEMTVWTVFTSGSLIIVWPISLIVGATMGIIARKNYRPPRTPAALAGMTGSAAGLLIANPGNWLSLIDKFPDLISNRTETTEPVITVGTSAVAILTAWMTARAATWWGNRGSRNLTGREATAANTRSRWDSKTYLSVSIFLSTCGYLGLLMLVTMIQF